MPGCAAVQQRAGARAEVSGKLQRGRGTQEFRLGEIVQRPLSGGQVVREPQRDLLFPALISAAGVPLRV